MKNLFFSIFVILFISIDSFAQKSVVEKNMIMTSQEKNLVAARSAMVAEAYHTATTELVKEIIGESKFNKNKSLIQQKILKNTARFIPFSKNGEVQPASPSGFTMNILLKVSLSDLQSVLLENGLFYASDNNPMILPTVKFIDKTKSKSFVWWLPQESSEKSFLIKQNLKFEDQLKNALTKSNFYLLRTQQFKYAEAGYGLPKDESMRLESWQSTAQKLGAQIQIAGEVSFANSSERTDGFVVAIHLTALQTMNGRVVAEITRKFETEPGVFQNVIEKKTGEVFESSSNELATQILEAWQKGSLAAEFFKLKISGRLPILFQESFKDILKNKAREIKSVNERLITAQSLVYEIDASIRPQDLAMRAGEIDLGSGIKLVLESVGDKEIIYRVQK